MRGVIRADVEIGARSRDLLDALAQIPTNELVVVGLPSGHAQSHGDGAEHDLRMHVSSEDPLPLTARRDETQRSPLSAVRDDTESLHSSNDGDVSSIHSMLVRHTPYERQRHERQRRKARTTQGTNYARRELRKHELRKHEDRRSRTTLRRR